MVLSLIGIFVMVCAAVAQFRFFQRGKKGISRWFVLLLLLGLAFPIVDRFAVGIIDPVEGKLNIFAFIAAAFFLFRALLFERN